MEYQIIGPSRFEQIIARESAGAKFADISQTIKILKEAITHPSFLLSPLQDMIFHEKIGNIITSSSVKSIPQQGIYFDGKQVPFGFPGIYRERSKKIISSHPLLKSILPPDSLQDFRCLLRKGKMGLYLEEGIDSGFKWESRIFFDIDYQDDFLSLEFDRPVYESASSNRVSYVGFLIN